MTVERFPTTLSVPAESVPAFLTDVKAMPSGYEGPRTKRWNRDKRTFTLSFNKRQRADIDVVKAWWFTRYGRGDTFRYRDPDDHTLSPTDYLGVGDGTEQTFDVYQFWTAGGVTYQRRIYALDDDCQVYEDGSPVGGYTIDIVNARITGSPAIGVKPSIGGNYDCVVRFADDDSLKLLSLGAVRFGTRSMTLVEVWGHPPA